MTTKAEFNAGGAAAIAAEIGCPQPWKQTQGRLSTHFAYFHDDDRFVVVAGDATGADADLALAYGLTWRGDRRLVLALPEGHWFASAQRAAWMTDDAKPEIVTHDGNKLVGSISVTPDEAVKAVAARIPNGDDPQTDLRKASEPMYLGTRTSGVAALTEWATMHPLLDSAHVQSYRAWHHMGQSVLQMNKIRGGVRVRAGINDKAGLGSTSFDVKTGTSMSSADVDECIAWVEKAITARAEGALSKPDEHWLQAALRQEPRLAGVEHPALREVPAWRPRSDPDGPLARGYVDLLGLDGNGDIRVVETKLTANNDLMLVFQGLDYYTWALAYADALRNRLGVSTEPRITLCYLIGSTPDATLKVSPYAQAQVDAISPAVPALYLGITQWFRPAHKNKEPEIAVLDPAALPT